jgi:hypothetical protein
MALEEDVNWAELDALVRANLVPARQLWARKLVKRNRGGYPEERQEMVKVTDPREATLIGAKGSDGRYYPLFDLDIPCTLVASETAGHTHLYVNHGMNWSQYKKVLIAMGNAGILEAQWVKMAVNNEDAHVAIRPWKAGGA